MNMTSTLPISTINTITSSRMAVSDSESSQLVEAVAALNVGRPSPSAKTPVAKSIKVGPTPEVDSGYASKNPSQSSTPDTLKGPLVDGRGVVGGPRWELPLRPKKKLTPFEKPIPKLTRDRFENLRELHADNLNRLTRGLPRCRGILMSLKVLGETESTAAPWVFIQCDKVIARKVRRFFKQPSVESDFKPPHPNAYNPKFDIYVHEMPPMALHGNISPPPPTRFGVYEPDATKVYCDENAIIESGSLCGAKISVSINGQLRTATIGGLISTQTTGGETRLLGITAGHFLTEDQYTQYPDEAEDNDFEDGFLDDGQHFELDLSSFDCGTSATLKQNDIQPEVPKSFETVIGYVYRTSQDNFQEEPNAPNLDWALFTIERPFSSFPNVIRERKIARVDYHFPDPAEVDRKVTLTTAMSGLVSGVLSMSWSYLMLAPGRSLTRTNAVTILDNKVLQPGDSGSWVVDDITNAVYGHVVAADVFGVAYIVTMKDILENISVRLSLEVVDLPFIRTQSETEPRSSAAIHDSIKVNELEDLLSGAESDIPEARFVKHTMITPPTQLGNDTELVGLFSDRAQPILPHMIDHPTSSPTTPGHRPNRRSFDLKTTPVNAGHRNPLQSLQSAASASDSKRRASLSDLKNAKPMPSQPSTTTVQNLSAHQPYLNVSLPDLPTNKLPSVYRTAESPHIDSGYSSMHSSPASTPPSRRSRTEA